MKKWFWLGSILAVGSVSAIAYPFITPNTLPKAALVKPKLVNAMKNVKDFNRDFTGCRIWGDSAEKDLLFFEIDNKPAQMNINGQDVTLKILSSFLPKAPKVGNKWESVYQFDKVEVAIFRTTTFLDRTKNGYFMKFNVKMTAQNGEQTETIHGTGDCQ
jgi:hypothetical protein